MAVIDVNLQVFYTALAAVDVGTAITSLGITKSATQVSNVVLSNIFDLVTGDESSAGNSEYRILAFYNASATNTAIDVYLHFPVNYESMTGTDDISIALLAGISAGDDMVSALTDESTEPAIEGNWIQGGTRATGLSLGNVPAESFRLFAVRRVIGAGANPADGAEFQIEMSSDTGE